MSTLLLISLVDAITVTINNDMATEIRLTLECTLESTVDLRRGHEGKEGEEEAALKFLQFCVSQVLIWIPVVSSLRYPHFAD